MGFGRYQGCYCRVQLLWLLWLWCGSYPVASQSYLTPSSAATLSGRVPYNKAPSNTNSQTVRCNVESKDNHPVSSKSHDNLPQQQSSSASSSSSSPPRRRRKQKHADDHDRWNYELRRDEWMRQYGSLEALQSTFGTSTRRFGGDLTPEQTRRLYHALLPRSLFSLYESGLMRPDELAPLAFQARVAAKAYARSRCVWTGRLITSLFDQYRSVRDKGKLLLSSKEEAISWEDLWNKYEAQIVQEECQAAMEEPQDDEQPSSPNSKSANNKQPSAAHNNNNDDEDDSLTMRIYLRILQKSCATNAAFDSLFLRQDEPNNNNNNNDKVDLVAMGQKLERDVQEILLDPRQNARMRRQQARAAKRAAKAQEKEAKLLAKAERKEQKQREKEQRKLQKQQLKDEEDRQPESGDNKSKSATSVLANKPNRSSNSNVMVRLPDPINKNPRTSASSRWEALRVLAGTRRMFRLLATTSSSATKRKRDNGAEPLRGGGDSTSPSTKSQTNDNQRKNRRMKKQSEKRD